jgi:hypothetical protein
MQATSIAKVSRAVQNGGKEGEITGFSFLRQISAVEGAIWVTQVPYSTGIAIASIISPTAFANHIAKRVCTPSIIVARVGSTNCVSYAQGPCGMESRGTFLAINSCPGIVTNAYCGSLAVAVNTAIAMKHYIIVPYG